MKDLTLIVHGEGTAGLAATKELLAPRKRALPIHRAILVDSDTIERKNGTSCPEYAGHEGRWKVDRAREVALERAPGVEVVALSCSVEEFDWEEHVPAPSPEDAYVLVIALDDWDSRVNSCQGLREFAAGRTDRDVAMLMLGLDRGQASISFLGGSAWTDPCVICGLPGGILPGPAEPCIVFRKDGSLLRGDLRAEARMAARWCRWLLWNHFISGKRSVLNTKANLWLDEQGSARQLTRLATRTEACLGPHFPASPIRWDRICGATSGESPWK